MCDKRIFWALPACVALAGCVAGEPVPLADAVAEAGPYSEYIGVPPAALFDDIGNRESDEVVFVTVNDNGSVTIARADGVEVVLTAEAIDGGEGCAEGSGELVCETADGATLSFALATQGAGGEEPGGEELSGGFEPAVALTRIAPSEPDRGAPGPGFATGVAIGGGTLTLPGGATDTLPGGATRGFSGTLGVSVPMGGGLPSDSLPGRSPVTQTFGSGIAGPDIPGVLVVPAFLEAGAPSPGEHGRAIAATASQGGIGVTPRGPATSD